MNTLTPGKLPLNVKFQVTRHDNSQVLIPIYFKIVTRNSPQSSSWRDIFWFTVRQRLSCVTSATERLDVKTTYGTTRRCTTLARQSTPAAMTPVVGLTTQWQVSENTRYVTSWNCFIESYRFEVSPNVFDQAMHSAEDGQLDCKICKMMLQSQVGHLVGQHYRDLLLRRIWWTI